MFFPWRFARWSLWMMVPALISPSVASRTLKSRGADEALRRRHARVFVFSQCEVLILAHLQFLPYRRSDQPKASSPIPFLCAPTNVPLVPPFSNDDPPAAECSFSPLLQIPLSLLRPLSLCSRVSEGELARPLPMPRMQKSSREHSLIVLQSSATGFDDDEVISSYYTL